MISERLRNETAGHHEAIENARRFSRLGSDDFSLQEYIEILEKFYGFYKPLEEAFRKHPDVMAALAYDRRFKLPLLRADLLHFGHTDESLAKLEQCADLPPTETQAQVLGAIYVMEGSTHGSQFIAKRLRERFELDGDGLAFYEGYGKDTMPQWKAFKAYMDSAQESNLAQDGDAIVASAAATFNALHHWMD